MHWRAVLKTAGMCAAFVGLSATALWSQGGPSYLAPASQVVAVRAARFYDPKTSNILTNQVVLIRVW